MWGKNGQKKRFWSDEEKQTICDQARVDGISVAQVARRYSMNTSLIHKWLRDPRFGPTGAISDIGTSSFLPIEIKGMGSSLCGADLSEPAVQCSASDVGLYAHRVDITLSDGRRILIEGSTSLSSVLALVDGLHT